MHRRRALLIAGRKRSGLAIVEFALAFLGFLIVLVAAIECGRAVWTFNTIAHATRQGARVAMARGSEYSDTQDERNTRIENAVRNAAVGLSRTDVSVTTTWPLTIDRGQFVQVSVSYPFRTVTGGLVLQQSLITIRASSRVPLMN